jgi:hypothetical protein
MKKATRKQVFTDTEKQLIEDASHRMMDSIRATLMCHPPKLHNRTFDMFLFCLAETLTREYKQKMVKYLKITGGK